MESLRDQGEDLATNLRSDIFGSTKVVAVDVYVDQDPEGEPAIYLDVVLTDPVGDTWPFEDVLAIRRKVMLLTEAAQIGASTYVRLSPESFDRTPQDEPALWPS